MSTEGIPKSTGIHQPKSRMVHIKRKGYWIINSVSGGMLLSGLWEIIFWFGIYVHRDRKTGDRRMET